VVTLSSVMGLIALTIDVLASSISTPPDKKINLPSQDVCVVLTEDNLETVKKAASVLQIPDVSLVGDGERIYPDSA
jgi:hypothetical protein